MAELASYVAYLRVIHAKATGSWRYVGMSASGSSSVATIADSWYIGGR